MPTLKLSNPFRWGTDRPSLKERAAALKATASRLMGRMSDKGGTDQSRRMLVAGSVAAVVATPLPALASAVLPGSAPGPHPDQALFDAEATYLAARSAEHAASIDIEQIYAAYGAALGDLPDALVFPRWAVIATAHPGMPLWPYRIERRSADMPNGTYGQRWTARGLRDAIAALPKAFGRAGTTPKLIRDLRAALPVAEAYEARVAELEGRYRTADATAAWNRAEKETRLARAEILGTVAMTLAGLAVQVRYAATCDWHTVSGPWACLMRSAAAVSGVALAEADFDAAEWVRDWTAIGGRLRPLEPGSPLDVIAPRGVPLDAEEEERRLLSDLAEHRDAITRYMRVQG